MILSLGRVHSARFDGSDYRIVAELGDAIPLGAAADGEHVFWVATRYVASDSLESANGSVAVLTTDLQASTASFPALTVTGGWVFFARASALGDELVRVPGNGGDVEALTLAGLTIGPIATDGERVFYGRGSAGLYAVSAGGGAEERFASGVGTASDVAADETDVFALSETGLWRIPKSGASPERLAAGGGRAVALDAAHVHWRNEDGDVFRAKKSGAQRQRIASGSGIDFDVAVAGDVLFWTSGTEILRRDL